MKHSACPRSPAFTLIELLVSMSVLGLLVVLIVQLLNSAANITTHGNKRLDADGEARMVFDRMGQDFSAMIKRKDVDYIFYKNTATGTSAVNDAMFFYSEAPGYNSASPAPSPGISQSPVTLVGYRIHQNMDPTDPSGTRTIPQLERLGQGLSWDSASKNSDAQPGGMVFLAFPSPSPVGTPDQASTLAGTSGSPGNWSTAIGTMGASYTDGVSGNYDVLGAQVYRMELAFLLSDGTTSPTPIRSIAPSGASPKFYTANSADPGATTDSAAGYTVGSRWLNTTTNSGFICQDATAGAARWLPIGIQDVTAVIVGLAILDANSQKIVTDRTKMIQALLDPTATDLSATPPVLMSQSWVNAANNFDNAGKTIDFAGLSGLPRAAAQEVRVYQRYFYLNK